MKNLRVLVFIAVIFCCGLARAQVNNLRIGNLVFGPVHIGDSDIVNITIHNDSAVAYGGRILFGSIVGSDTTRIDTLSSGTIYYPGYNVFDSIRPFDSIVRSLIIRVTDPPFIVGPSGVVIWPIVKDPNGDFISSTDTLRTILFALNPLGVADRENPNLKVFMDENQLLIRGDVDSKPGEVKLYSISGALLVQKALSLSTAIDMNSFSDGVYLAELWFADNTRKVIKVFKAK